MFKMMSAIKFDMELRRLMEKPEAADPNKFLDMLECVRKETRKIVSSSEIFSSNEPCRKRPELLQIVQKHHKLLTQPLRRKALLNSRFLYSPCIKWVDLRFKTGLTKPGSTTRYPEHYCIVNVQYAFIISRSSRRRSTTRDVQECGIYGING